MAQTRLTLAAFEQHVTATNQLNPGDTETPLLGLVPSSKPTRRVNDGYRIIVGFAVQPKRITR
jgi:hypothetical protein